jgi:signal transduction histidine kinase/tetratricopeptide (TPR) repeat protein
VYHKLFKFSKQLLSLGLLLGAFLQASGQNSHVIDSLRDLVNERKGKGLFDVYYELTFQYFESDNLEKALELAGQAKATAFDIGDSLSIVKSGRVRSQILRRLDRPKDAIHEFLFVLPIAKRNNFTTEVKYILNGLGLAYTLQSDYDKALEAHLEVLLIRERENDSKEIYSTLNNIGLVYFKLKDYDRALENYFRALDYDTKLGSTPFRPSLLNNIALCYNQKQDYLEARKYINQAFEACADKCNDAFKVEGQFALGVSYFIQAKAENSNSIFTDASKYFLEAKNIARRLNDKRWQLENLVYLSRIYTQTRDFKQAKQSLDSAEMIAKGTEYNLLLIEIYKGFSLLYKETGDFKSEAEYQNKYIDLKDSVYSETLIRNLSSVTTRYEERVNIATIKSNEQVIKQQRDLNVSFAIIALLAGLLILLVQRSNRTIKRVNVALSDAKNTIEEQNAKLQILNTDLDAEVKLKTSDLEKANQSLHRVVEELDNFIYKTSHDIRGPLASLKGICNIALLDVKDEVALKYLYKLDVTAEKLNTILTRLLIVNQINNSSLKTDELVNFEQVVNDVLLLERKKGLPPRLKIDKFIEKDLRFFSDKEFVRIILENLIDNAIKFYNDSERIEPFVKIYISKEKEQIIIRVIDNGIGISEIHPDKIFQMFSRASERSETGGIGLFITKTATEKLGGSVSLKTTPEGFTEFFVRFNVDGDGWRR